MTIKSFLVVSGGISGPGHHRAPLFYYATFLAFWPLLLWELTVKLVIDVGGQKTRRSKGGIDVICDRITYCTRTLKCQHFNNMKLLISSLASFHPIALLSMYILRVSVQSAMPRQLLPNSNSSLLFLDLLLKERRKNAKLHLKCISHLASVFSARQEIIKRELMDGCESNPIGRNRQKRIIHRNP